MSSSGLLREDNNGLSPETIGLLQAGASIMRNSGWRNRPITATEQMGHAIPAGLQAYSQAKQQEAMQAQAQAQAEQQAAEQQQAQMEQQQAMAQAQQQEAEKRKSFLRFKTTLAELQSEGLIKGAYARALLEQYQEDPKGAAEALEKVMQPKEEDKGKDVVVETFYKKNPVTNVIEIKEKVKRPDGTTYVRSKGIHTPKAEDKGKDVVIRTYHKTDPSTGLIEVIKVYKRPDNSIYEVSAGIHTPKEEDKGKDIPIRTYHKTDSSTGLTEIIKVYKRPDNSIYEESTGIHTPKEEDKGKDIPKTVSAEEYMKTTGLPVPKNTKFVRVNKGIPTHIDKNGLIINKSVPEETPEVQYLSREDAKEQGVNIPKGALLRVGTDNSQSVVDENYNPYNFDKMSDEEYTDMSDSIYNDLILDPSIKKTKLFAANNLSVPKKRYEQLDALLKGIDEQTYHELASQSNVEAQNKRIALAREKYTNQLAQQTKENGWTEDEIENQKKLNKLKLKVLQKKLDSKYQYLTRKEFMEGDGKGMILPVGVAQVEVAPDNRRRFLDKNGQEITDKNKRILTLQHLNDETGKVHTYLYNSKGTLIKDLGPSGQDSVAQQRFNLETANNLEKKETVEILLSDLKKNFGIEDSVIANLRTRAKIDLDETIDVINQKFDDEQKKAGQIKSGAELNELYPGVGYLADTYYRQEGTGWTELRPEDIKGADSLRKEYNRLTRDFRIAARGHDGVMEGLSHDSGFGDIMAITSFRIMFEPNSVVREAEFAITERAGGVLNSIMNTPEKIWDGDKLKPEVRATMRSLVTNYMNAVEERANKHYQNYLSIAKGRRYKNNANIQHPFSTYDFYKKKRSKSNTGSNQHKGVPLVNVPEK